MWAVRIKALAGWRVAIICHQLENAVWRTYGGRGMPFIPVAKLPLTSLTAIANNKLRKEKVYCLNTVFEQAKNSETQSNDTLCSLLSLLTASL
jgi:hypothetical protein